MNSPSKDTISEAAAPDMNATHEASMITEVVLSVVRDQAISSLYGCQMNRQQSLPDIQNVFTEPCATRIVAKLQGISPGALNVPLYSGWGDLLGQLSRILIICHERSALSSYLNNADTQIEKIGLSIEQMNDGEFVRHLRNAVMHCRFVVDVCEDDFRESKFVFTDVKPGSGEITGRISCTSEQLNKVIEILIKEVCLKYLSDAGWEIGSAS